MNIITIKGRLTADTETKQSKSGKTMCAFSVAVPRRFNKDETDFISCVAFGKTAQFIAQYFKRGQEILLNGELHIDKYTAKDGQPRTAVKIVVDNVEFCGGKSESQSVSESKPQNGKKDEYDIIVDDDSLPF